MKVKIYENAVEYNTEKLFPDWVLNLPINAYNYFKDNFTDSDDEDIEFSFNVSDNEITDFYKDAILKYSRNTKDPTLEKIIRNAENPFTAADDLKDYFYFAPDYYDVMDYEDEDDELIADFIWEMEDKIDWVEIARSLEKYFL